MLTTILAAAVVLGVLIFVHELGHFLTAKLVDIEVPRFSIGFGPRVFGFRRGETEYVISALPLGGYVKMAGMEEMEDIEGKDPRPRAPETDTATAAAAAAATDPSTGVRRERRPRDFESKSLAARTLVISAGVIMNLLFAYVVFTLVGLFWGAPRVPESVIGNIVEERLPEGAGALMELPRGVRLVGVGNDAVADFTDLQIALSTARAGPIELRFADHPAVTIDVPSSDSARQTLIAAFEPVAAGDAVLDGVTEGGPADAAGLQAGDRILSADGIAVESWQDFGSAIEKAAGRPLPVVVLRGVDTLSLTVTPEARTFDGVHYFGRIGVSARPSPFLIPRERLGPLRALGFGASETWRWTRLTVDVLAGIFSGRVSARSVGGPILITQISGEAARAGLEAFLNFMALLSVNLAVLNILPIPVLDGGHLVFLGIEAIRGRPVSVQQRVRLTRVGMALIIALMAFAVGNDIVRWIGL
ncbi:MAG: RIP metalloprotease RseP [Gemmatimonadetes bacterium]|nr:RIP metalloprotease RseP [Gemmatimonadota bacterium]